MGYLQLSIQFSYIYNQVPKQNRVDDEIEEIFSSKKKPENPDIDETSHHKESLKEKKKILKDKPTKKKRFSQKGEEGETTVSDCPRRRTADGLAIYSAEELRLGLGL
ncbi:hypothetical protein QJS10_CPA03g01745 [Acorus calamus]|uniref:Uncharacterized protein n=1 Tax=Acorus calamus TaxID=4465 RepID=A0AAV9F2Y7_ACOCL|nr:hypothetical protein QJS10_CPA03g01745 [Acorus calamus]